MVLTEVANSTVLTEVINSKLDCPLVDPNAGIAKQVAGVDHGVGSGLMRAALSAWRTRTAKEQMSFTALSNSKPAGPLGDLKAHTAKQAVDGCQRRARGKAQRARRSKDFVRAMAAIGEEQTAPLLKQTAPLLKGPRGVEKR